MSWRLFTADLRTAARAWKLAPGLPALTLVVIVVGHTVGALLPAGFTVFMLPLIVVEGGFYGTQRLWY